MNNKKFNLDILSGKGISSGEYLEENNDTIILPVLSLRGMLVYPYMNGHLDVGRDRSINAVEEAMEDEEALIFLAMQKDPQTDEPEAADIYTIGTVAKIKQLIKLPGRTIRIVVEGLYRAEIVRYIQDDPYIIAQITKREEYLTVSDIEAEALMRTLNRSFDEYAKNSKKVSPEAMIALTSIENPGQFADVVAANLTLKLSDRQAILDELCVNKRLEALISIVTKEIEIVELEKTIVARVRQQMEKSQKEYYLREQLKAIQKELGEKDERIAEVEEIRERMSKITFPEEIELKLNREIERLEKMPPMVAEAMIVRNYIDWLLDLPWDKGTEDCLDIKEAEKILDEDHYGLEKAKERILEYLASCQLKKGLKGPILCFVGPPGVGKTSLARSIARALGRKFVRMSLGGVRDEAEIRGHRRTYIGAMPGRIMQSIKLAESKNSLFLLDEIDKMSSDFRGDPASALLEVLDPEQNNTFVDHYLEVPFDLSQTMFITTANISYDIPRPLLDRMEIIHITSYTEEEKLQIAVRHLVPKQIKEHGLDDYKISFSESAIRMITRAYTREAGVRELERKIAKICRALGRDIIAGKKGPYKVTEANVRNYLGMQKYLDSQPEKEAQIGVVNGLAWTEVGGELLVIEVQTLSGKGKMTITGHLGDVMKESAQAGFTYIRSIADKLAINDNIEENTDFHIHVPEGAIPKDGPSAGITIATALASQLTGRPVKASLAMTGEVTLRGRVLPVGGIKEKLLAAYRGGLETVIMPKENEKDLEEIPQNIRKKLHIHLVDSMSDVLELALMPDPKQQKSNSTPVLTKKRSKKQ